MYSKGIGAVLRALREQKGLTQVGVAKKANVTQAYIAQLEAGIKKNPSLAMLKRLAKALDVPVEQLFSTTEMHKEARPMFYVHLNMTHRYAMLHEGPCSFCKHGRGIHRRVSGKNTTWSEPFGTLIQASAWAEAEGYEVSRCQWCL